MSANVRMLHGAELCQACGGKLWQEVWERKKVALTEGIGEEKGSFDR